MVALGVPWCQLHNSRRQTLLLPCMHVYVPTCCLGRSKYSMSCVLYPRDKINASCGSGINSLWVKILIMNRCLHFRQINSLCVMISLQSHTLCSRWKLILTTDILIRGYSLKMETFTESRNDYFKWRLQTHVMFLIMLDTLLFV